jgi:hypothetical protein
VTRTFSCDHACVASHRVVPAVCLLCDLSNHSFLVEAASLSCPPHVRRCAPKNAATRFSPLAPPLSGRHDVVFCRCHRWPCLSQPWFLANLAPRRRLFLTTMSGAGRRGPKFGPLLCLVVGCEPSTFSCLESIADTLTRCLAVLRRRGAPPTDRRASGVRRRVTKEPSRTSGKNPGWISGLGFPGLIAPGPMGRFRPTDC